MEVLHTKIGDIKSTGSDCQILVANADDDKANVLGDCLPADVYTCEPVGDFNELPYRYPTTACNEVIFSEEIILGAWFCSRDPFFYAQLWS